MKVLRWVSGLGAVGLLAVVVGLMQPQCPPRVSLVVRTIGPCCPTGFQKLLGVSSPQEFWNYPCYPPELVVPG